MYLKQWRQVLCEEETVMGSLPLWESLEKETKKSILHTLSAVNINMTILNILSNENNSICLIFSISCFCCILVLRFGWNIGWIYFDKCSLKEKEMSTCKYLSHVETVRQDPHKEFWEQGWTIHLESKMKILQKQPHKQPNIIIMQAFP